MTVKRTDSTDQDFIRLVSLLDVFLAEIDGEDHAFYAQFNKLDALRYAVVVYEGETPVACGAFKPFGDHAVEIKRMYVSPDHRRKGLAITMLDELEKWAAELGYLHCVLETGIRQSEAIALYQKTGYRQTENYGQYAGVKTSVCFEKKLSPTT
ncbi:GNAT family N-acetyltransferase [Sediminibacterium soli]|uniref:GNAT family N-acetyltransferase n=1 Tax=Sediminibacterium soli TaxID=2698829 RepID=UPI00137991FF|nr:GNAT family N-acetyltransferase [Sediminibacterium soli]NCI47110.1 GNAT family N-acetyltransferase [Sediminibacterium soli]